MVFTKLMRGRILWTNPTNQLIKEFTMSALILPDPIAAYFAADTRGPDDVARCFIAQGSVKDKGQTHTIAF